MTALHRYLITLAACLLAYYSFGQSDQPSWKAGDEDMRYERYEDARTKYMSGINDTDVNTRVANLLGLILWESWDNDYDAADSLFAISEDLYPALTDPEIINRYMHIKSKTLLYAGKYNAALAKAYELKNRLDGQTITKMTISNHLSIAGLYEHLNIPDSISHYAEMLIHQSEGIIDSMDATMSSIYRIAAIAALRLNDYEVSEQRFLRALSIAEAAIGKESFAYRQSYGNLPILYSQQGDYHKSIQHGLEAAALDERRGDIAGQGLLLSNVGIQYYYIGDFGKAIFYLQQARDLKAQVYGEGHNKVAGAKRLLGIMYEVSGDYKRASEYYQSVLQTYQASDDVPSSHVVEVYNVLAGFNIKLRNFELAKEQSAKAIELIKSGQGETHYDLSYNYLSMGTIMTNLNDADEAVRYAKLSNKIERLHLGEETITFALSNSNLATAYALQNRLDKAIAAADRSYALLQDDGGRLTTMSIDGVYILANRARVFNIQAKENPTDEHIETYINEVKKLIRYTDEYRTKFSDAFSKSGHLEVANLIYRGILGDIFDLYQLNNDRRLLEITLEIIESSKAAILKDVINENVIKFSNIPDSLKSEETALKDAYITLNYDYNEDLQNDSLRQALQSARFAHNNFVDEHVLTDPKYFAMRGDSIKLKITEIQSNITADEVVVEYFKEFSNYYALTISEKEVSFFKLGQVTIVDSLIEVWQSKMVTRDDGINLVSNALYNTLWLPLGIKADMNHVTIVPAGTLWLLSFEALHDGEAYLVMDHVIQYSLSLEVDKFVQRFRKGKNESLAIFAPGWEDDLKDSYKSRVADSSLFDKEYLNVLRQPWSLHLSNYLDDNFDIVSYNQEEATEANFKSQIDKMSILHFASHAVVNNEDPLRSKVHLAKDPQVNSENDGYLYAYEIFDMSLDADLAVLGACETGVGQMKEGEGMLSLSYAMQYAGCASTIMSLWKIDESSSTDIFSKFYQSLSQGVSISDALHTSKLEFLQDQENVNLQHPYYWAGTVFMGLNHVVPLQPKSDSYLMWILFGVAILLVVFGLYKRLLSS